MNSVFKAVYPVYSALVRSKVGRRLMHIAARASSEADVVADFIESSYGEQYGVTSRARRELVTRFQQNNIAINSGTNALIHIVLAREILSVPADVRGDVIECGAWKGASSSSLSLVCRMAGRRLLVCDSFEGLPDDGLQPHLLPYRREYGYYRQGMFHGALDEVYENVRHYGDIERCEFIKGFFADSLKMLSQPLVFAFLDVDLVSSTKDCLRFIWPLLVDGGVIYTDDSLDLDVVRVFFDEAWWRGNLNCQSPGYIGSGCGLPLGSGFASLGYTRKIVKVEEEKWSRTSFLHYPELSLVSDDKVKA